MTGAATPVVDDETVKLCAGELGVGNCSPLGLTETEAPVTPPVHRRCRRA